jgi:phage terminase small subunit
MPALPPAPPSFDRIKASIYVPDLGGMSEMQRRFCEEYLQDLRPKDAAIRAGYSKNPAYAAAQIMKHPPCAEHIQRLMAQRSRRVGLSADRVLDRLGLLVFGDTRDLYDKTGRLRPMQDLSQDSAAMIAGVKTRRTVELGADGKTMEPVEYVEVKHVDGLAALTLAMKHLGMLNEKLDVNVVHTLADRLQAAHRRIRGGTIIEGDTFEETAARLDALEQESQTLQRQVTFDTREAAPAYSGAPVGLEDIW